MAKQSRTGRSKETYKELLDIAEARRTLEINLFWQRALFFWGFTIAAFTAYAYFFTIPSPNYAEMLCVASFGLLSSVVWAMVNRGSRFWQGYWEYQIDIVKKEAVKHGGDNYIFFQKAGDYQKEIEGLFKKRFLDAVRFSPSRLMIALSDYITASWALILVGNTIVVLYISSVTSPIGYLAVLFAIGTVIYAISVYTRTKEHDDRYPISGKNY